MEAVFVTDWAAVAAAINTRLADLGLTQAELSARSRVSTAMLREIQNPDRYPPRPRHPRTLEAISAALGWPISHLAQVLNGDKGAADEPGLTAEIRAMRADLDELRERMTALEDRMSGT